MVIQCTGSKKRQARWLCLAKKFSCLAGGHGKVIEKGSELKDGGVVQKMRRSMLWSYVYEDVF